MYNITDMTWAEQRSYAFYTFYQFPVHFIISTAFLLSVFTPPGPYESITNS